MIMELVSFNGGSPVQGLREESATQKYKLGQRYAPPWDPLGRVYRYAYAGAAITPGKLLGAAALSGAGTTLQTAASVSVAAVIGDKKIFLTIVTTAQAADLFADGIAVVNDVSLTPDEFYTFAVKGNSALATTGTTGYIELYEPIPVALTTSDKVDLTVNPWKSVVEMPVTTHTGSPIGVAGINVTSGYYFWAQTWGPCGIMSNAGPLTIGAAVQSSVDIAGGVASMIAGAGSLVQPQIGLCLNVSTDVYGATVFLQIAP
jgi:hypothetical protein